MIRQLYVFLLRILPRQRIPPLPRGMLSADFDSMSLDERRVLARLGARDPRGVKVAMQRAKVDNVEALVDQLEHYQPRREVGRRVDSLLCRLEGSTSFDPHAEEIRRDARQQRRASRPENVEIKRRLKTVLHMMESE